VADFKATLKEGEYVVTARDNSEGFKRNLKVEPGWDTEIEVMAK